MQVKRFGKCARCGRVLSDPVSVGRGYGPLCWGKEGRRGGVSEAKDASKNALKMPFEGDIICNRGPSGAEFNIPHRLVEHSPWGMEWGYGGSGPADFALNILAMFTTDENAGRLHQEFKWKFVATLPPAGGVIKRADILAWLEAHGVRAAA